MLELYPGTLQNIIPPKAQESDFLTSAQNIQFFNFSSRQVSSLMAGLKIVLSLALLCVGDCVRDLTILPGQVGCEVTYATIEKIETSKIFVDHKFMLNRISFVNEFGEKSLVVEGKGIWEITQDMLEVAIDTAIDKNLVSQIEDVICISWSTVTLDDMEKPIYAGVAAILLLESVRRVPFYNNIYEQASTWVAVARMETKYTDTFIQYYTEYSSYYQQTGVKCMQCQTQPSDVVFVLDDSGSISDSEWRFQSQFVTDFAVNFKVGFKDDESRMGLVMFAKAAVSFDYKRCSSGSPKGKAISDVFASYKRMAKHTYTELGILSAQNMILGGDETGSRYGDSSVRQIMIVLTDGKASHPDKLRKAMEKFRKKTYGVNVFAIGTDKKADLKELRMIAGDDKNARIYDNFEEFYQDTGDITRIVCSSTAVQPSRDPLPKNSDPNNGGIKVNNAKYKFKVKASIKTTHVGASRHFSISYDSGSVTSFHWTTKQSMEVYYSFSHKHPSYYMNDFKTVVQPGKKTPSIIKPTDTYLDGICPPPTPPTTTELTTTTATTTTTLNIFGFTTLPPPTPPPDPANCPGCSTIHITIIPCVICININRPAPKCVGVTCVDIGGDSSSGSDLSSVDYIKIDSGSGGSDANQATTVSAKQTKQTVAPQTTTATQKTTIEVDAPPAPEITTVVPSSDATIPGQAVPSDESQAVEDGVGAPGEDVDNSVDIKDDDPEQFLDYQVMEPFGNQVGKNYLAQGRLARSSRLMPEFLMLGFLSINIILYTGK